VTDDQWRQLAEASREALILLGHDVPNCLPGEAGACGGRYAEHAGAQLAALKAVADHHLAHLGSFPRHMEQKIRAMTLADLEANCGDQP
jgi:fructose-bisphosphate aldolase class 1